MRGPAASVSHPRPACRASLRTFSTRTPALRLSSADRSGQLSGIGVARARKTRGWKTRRHCPGMGSGRGWAWAFSLTHRSSALTRSQQLLEAPEAAFDDVAGLAALDVESGWPSADGTAPLPVGDLVGTFGDYGPETPPAQSGAIAIMRNEQQTRPREQQTHPPA